jgi:hypothetical protein
MHRTGKSIRLKIIGRPALRECKGRQPQKHRVPCLRAADSFSYQWSGTLKRCTHA